jgi:hypothetical protein
LAAASAQGAPPPWVGQVFTASPTGNSIGLVSLSPNASALAQLSSTPVGTETVNFDTFRCVPYGAFCMALTNDGQGNSALYNFSDVSGGEVDRAAMPGALGLTLHVDHFSGVAFSAATTNGGKGVAVFSVAGAAVRQVIDLTSFLKPGQSLRRGGATHCSNEHRVFVHLAPSAPGGQGQVISVDVNSGSVVNVQPTTFAFDAMWAYCGSDPQSDVVGGTVFEISATGDRTLYYGTVDAASGHFVPGPSVAVPATNPPLAPSGFLSMGERTDFVATLYPEGTTPSSTTTKGMTASWDEGDSSMTLAPIGYVLAGAALVQ